MLEYEVVLLNVVYNILRNIKKQLSIFCDVPSCV